MANKLNLTNIVDELKKKYQTTSQNVSSGLKNYWGGVKQRYNEGGGISQFTPLSMRSQIVPSTMATAEGVRRIFNTNPQKTYQTAQDIGYGLRGALSLTPFQSVKTITPKLQQIQNISNPQTFRQQAAQSIGRGIYGSMLTAPLAGGALGVAKNAIVGTGLGVGMGVGSDLITGKKITKQRLAEHAMSGFENSWVLPITNAITNKTLSLTGAKNLVGKNITAPFANGQVKQGLARVFTRALAEVPAENTAFTWLGRLDDTSKESFMKDWMMNLPGNVVSNLAFAGVQGGWNMAANKEARQAINKALKDTIRHWTMPVATTEYRNGKRITMPMWQYKMSQGKAGLSVQDLSKLTPEDYKKATGKEAPNVTKAEFEDVNLPKSTLEVPTKTEPTISKTLSTTPQLKESQVVSTQPIITPESNIKLKSLAEGERKIDELLGTGGSLTGNWKQDYAMRQELIRQTKEVAPPEVIKEVEKLEKAMFDLRNSGLKIEESKTATLNTIKAKSEIARIEKEFTTKFNKEIDKLKLDKKNFTINRDELGRPIGVSYTPNSEKVQKLKIISEERARLKTQDREYKEWSKAVFGEANARTTTKAVEDLTKQMKTSTNLGILDNADNWKDKPRLALANETMERNFTDVMGKNDGKKFTDELLEPVFQSEANRTRFLNKERSEIKSLGIKARSKESALVQELGEGKITEAQVREQFLNADKIIKAEKVLRQKYDSYLTMLNKVLTRNGYDPIPKRKDYFHHFEDLSGIFDEIGVAIKANDLPTDINGLTADFKPGRTFFNATLQRKGTKTGVDAITGIDKYLEGASNQIFHTDNIQRLRAFETALREKYAGTKHLTNFVADLGEYINHLAGKKAMVDRAMESLVGRKIYTATNTLKKQVGANMVGANITSAVTNFIPVTQTLATTNKISVGQAMLDIIKNVFKDDGFVDSSNFLTSRHGSDKLSINAWQNIGKKAGWLFKTIDSFTSQLAVRSKYLEGLKKGLSETEAMKAADMWGRKTLAGRSAGEMPTLFNSKTMGLLTQFQLEVNNQLSFIAKDIPRNFNVVGAASAIGQLFIYSYLFNNLYEKMFGRRPAIDPIGLAQQTYEDYTNPNMKKGQATKNLVSNISNQLPYVSTFTGGRIPLGSAIPNPFTVVSGDSNWKKEASKLFYLLPPTGGGQIKKSIEGFNAYNKGASISPAGRVRYPIPQTITNLLRTGVAGQYSTPEARQYFREGRNVLGEKQSQFLLNSEDKTGVYNKIMANRQKDNASAVGEVGGVIKENIYQYMDDKGEIKEIDLSFPIKEYKPTGNATLDKELLSDYKGSITSAKNDVMEALEVGAITQEQAITELEKLVSKSNSTKKAKKPKKITFKVTKYKAPKITVKKKSSVKLPSLKVKKPKKIKIVRRYTIKA